MIRLRELKGLGPKSEADLIAAGVCSVEALNRIGPIEAFLKLKAVNDKVSLNFLYALVGAVKGEHWLNVARRDKSFLLSELEGYQELQRILSQDPKT